MDNFDDLNYWLDNELRPLLEATIDLVNRTISVLNETQAENKRWIKYFDNTLQDHTADSDHHPSGRILNARLDNYEQRIDGKQALLYQKRKGRSEFD